MNLLIYKRPILVALVFVFLPACYQMSSTREPASQKSIVLPKAGLSGTTYDPKDQVPVVKTQEGFVEKPIPGVAVKASRPFKYTTYVGRSN